MIFREDMTLAEFGTVNHLSEPLLKEVFALENKGNIQQPLNALGLSPQEITKKVDKKLALEKEHKSKSWGKIFLKFFAWFGFLYFVFHLMRQSKVTPKNRKILYLVAVVLFGVILGSDPSPMGTVKDAIVLLGANGVIFPPRMIALTLFLLLVLVANKFICSWGCQFGTLQDLIFRLNRKTTDRKGVIRQFKPSFTITNGIRILFFGLFTVVAFIWGFDLVEPIDPFKLYKPVVVGTIGMIFLIGILTLSLFVYRPWCTLFCPFGLVGWLVEKQSIFKINVNYATCEGCQTCAQACPSTAMETILKQQSTITDCFSCGSCIDSCPTASVSFRAGKRNTPPSGKFTDTKDQ